MKRVSVIIPCYNVESTVERTILSIISQKRVDIELLLINDGSTDSTLSVLEKFANSFDFINVVSQENRGVSTARNVGLKYARGEYVHFCDADDYLENKFYGLLDIIDGSYDIVLSGFILHKGKRVQCIYPPSQDKDIFVSYALGNRLHLGGFIFRRNYLLEHSLCFDENTYYGEDREFLFKSLFLTHNIRVISEAYYHYDMTREGSAMHTNYLTPRRLTSMWAMERVVKFVVDNKNCTGSCRLNAILIAQYVDTLYMYRKFLQNSSYGDILAYIPFFQDRLNRKINVRLCLGKGRYVFIYCAFYIVNRISALFLGGLTNVFT